VRDIVLCRLVEVSLAKELISRISIWARITSSGINEEYITIFSASRKTPKIPRSLDEKQEHRSSDQIFHHLVLAGIYFIPMYPNNSSIQPF